MRKNALLMSGGLGDGWVLLELTDALSADLWNQGFMFLTVHVARLPQLHLLDFCFFFVLLVFLEILSDMFSSCFHSFFLSCFMIKGVFLWEDRLDQDL